MQALTRRSLPRLVATALFVAGAIVGFIHYLSPRQLATPMTAIKSSSGRWSRSALQWTEHESGETLEADVTGNPPLPLLAEEEEPETSLH